MDRRKFLKWGSFLTISTATAGLAGCSNSSDDDDGAPGGDAGASYQFPQGVASGDPRPDSIILWTRVPGDNGAAVPLRVQMARDGGFRELLVDEAITVEPDWDHTVRPKVLGLDAAR